MSALRGTILLSLIALAVPSRALALCTTSTCEPDGTQPSGAVFRMCMPEPGCWNGDLVIWAHGYVAFNEPVRIPEDQLVIGGVSLPRLINNLGFGFATTSYRTNGLAVKDGIEDVRELVDLFRAAHGSPDRVYLTGASEGGLITTLAVEQFPETFDGGLAACGPIGDFRQQLDYFGDFRVVFDYFFPGLIPGSPVTIPPDVIANWQTTYVPRITAALRARPHAVDQLLRVTGAPTDPLVPATREATILGLLWYNVFATNDGVTKLGGQPFDNTQRFYSGSDNDFLLNLLVQRFAAQPVALDEVGANYQTSGRLISPLVTIHTTGDPIIPFGHEALYWLKTLFSGSLFLHDEIPVLRYGHCAFQPSEALVAFALLVLKVRGLELVGAEHALPDPTSRQEFLDLARKNGLAPQSPIP
ncbi:MAG TPA: prolyl oligopeptidase family serine peptidase [Vicinamibacteria bacterium]|jgi:pimeloyl-ACP methyl ester carboxylesterase|nr:prolyl oligopeptidase family serine peptidase [Vicinamibacteria bacterium]